MDMQAIPAREGKHNLKNYEDFRNDFSWEDVEKNFSWYETGKVNMAYEALDKHADNPDKKDKIALLYSDPAREEKMSFDQLRLQSNQFANVLKKIRCAKRGSCFSFYAKKSRVLYSIFWYFKNWSNCRTII